jgi:hypothetical protein
LVTGCGAGSVALVAGGGFAAAIQRASFEIWFSGYSAKSVAGNFIPLPDGCPRNRLKMR